MPRPSGMDEMLTPAFAEKMKKGPVMMITVMRGGNPGMGKPLAMWFLFSIVVGFFAAYVAGRVLAPVTDYLRVFQLVGATTFIAYSFAIWPLHIWDQRSLGTTIR